ncbi:MAG: hypothetical protein M0P57_08760 [Syntrophales bacterium]|jgi:hypothetical protein|nr:hypothetical protein [Syntrophales bacterium]MDY0044655.1 hypothetical protein [Syntrophales bacterium]
MNEEAMAQMNTEKKMEVIPGATHLFPEPGALEKVAELARQWFERYLKSTINSPMTDRTLGESRENTAGSARNHPRRRRHIHEEVAHPGRRS